VGLGVTKIPEEGSLTLFDKVELHLGGCACNTSLALAKLGVPAGLVAKVGRDGFGDFCLKELSRQGVYVSGVERSAKDVTSFSFIMVPPNGNRRILHTLGANATLSAQALKRAETSGTQWLCLGGLGLLPALTGKALSTQLSALKKKNNGLRVAVDTATNKNLSRRDWEELLGPCYQYLDVFFPSEEEARAITGYSDPKKICSAFQERGVKIAGVKLGAKGCAIQVGPQYRLFPAYKVSCVDTLGAGDCFMAGLLTGLLKEMSPFDAAQLGNAVSAACVQSLGATSGIKPLKNIVAFQKQQCRNRY
jgi:sugar/nucleoside kinase (ribokinase family)